MGKLKSSTALSVTCYTALFLDNPKGWDMKLSQVEFAHNHAMNRSTGFKPFQVVYSILPRGPIDLAPLPEKTRVHGKAADFLTGLQSIHQTVRDNLTTANAQYKHHADQRLLHVEFQVGDFVWAMLTKEHFSIEEYNKLQAKKIRPVKIIEKINPNAYHLQLPSHL